jgi:hypothetical protein
MWAGLEPATNGLSDPIRRAHDQAKRQLIQIKSSARQHIWLFQIRSQYGYEITTDRPWSPGRRRDEMRRGPC